MAGAARAQTNDPPPLPDAVKKASAAVVAMHPYGASGIKLGRGTGFVLEDGRIVTNAHVVTGADRVEVFSPRGTLLGVARYAEHLSTRFDLAILPRLSSESGLRLSQLVPSVGDRIVVVGAPEGPANSVAAGVIGAYRDISGSRRIELTAPVAPGSSGGPVVNLSGEVVGVSVATRASSPNAHFAVPATDLVALKSSPPGRYAFPLGESPLPTAQIAPGSVPAPVTVELGTPALGRLEAGDFVDDDTTYVDFFRIELRRGQTVTATLTASTFDPFLFLANQHGDDIAADDDSGGDLAARIVFTAPADGVYMWQVTSRRPGSGAYTLDVVSGALPLAATTDRESDPRWRRAGRAQSGAFVQDFDTQSLVVVGDQQYRVWVRTVYSSTQTSDGESYDRHLNLRIVDCARQRTRTLQTSVFLGERLVYSSAEAATPHWTAWAPESVGEGVARQVCAYAGSQR
jgi:hypothetical protein